MKENRMIIGRGEKIFLVLNNILMFGLVIITAYPFLYVVFAAFSNPAEFVKTVGLLYKPAGFSLLAFDVVLNMENMWIGLRNTLFYVIVGTIFNMTLTIMGAYPLSKKNLKLKRPIMLLLIFTMYFGGGMIPTYLLVDKLGLTNTIWAGIIPSMLSVYNMIVLRTAFSSLPESLYDAAAIDGASQLGTLLKIALPLSKGTLATLVLFNAVGKWNDWFFALTYLQKRRDLYPLQMFLRELLIQQTELDSAVKVEVGMDAEYYLLKETIKYAAIVVTTVPILLVYPFLQKYFVKGVLIGSVKE